MEKLEQCTVCGKNSFSNYLQGRDYFLTQEEFTIVKCDNCGFLFVNPRPDVNEISKYYKSEEYISHSNTKKGLLNKVYHIIRKKNHKKKFDLISSYKQSGTILDIGCATGEFLNFLKKQNWKTIGVEPDVTAQNFAKSKYGLNVFSEDFLDKTEPAKIDVITMWHVMEHVHILRQRMQQIKRLLVKDGIAFIAVPNVACYDARHYGEFWAGYDLPRHIYHFTQESMIRLFEKHNFKLDRIVPMEYDAYYISMLSEKYKSGSKNLWKAFWNGYRSNQWAKKNENNYSSLIFIFKNS
jgi:2-polyprenyl-3-methyl-5-hydroxy-6-metoxy-1,4-benzoquinol methylase